MMKKNCKLWLLLMLVALGMASCTINSDNPASVVDDKEFKADANKDTSVRPGDDFYMYCIGGWWNNTIVDESEPYKKLFMGQISDEMSKREAALTLPSKEKVLADADKTDAATIDAQKAELQSAIDRVNALTTQEEAWQLLAQLCMEGYRTPLEPTNFAKNGKMAVLLYLGTGKDYAVPQLWSKKSLSWQLANNPDVLARVRPLKGAATRGFDNGQWPMIVTFFNTVGISLDDVYTVDNYPPEIEAGSAEEDDELMSDFQEMSVEDWKMCLTEALKEDAVFFDDDAAAAVSTTRKDAVNNFLSKYLRYELSHAFAKAYVTADQKQLMTEYAEELRQTFRERIQQNTWMSAGSKQNATDKLNLMVFNIGAPDEWFEEGLADISKEQTLYDDIRALRRAQMNLKRKLTGMSIQRGSFHQIILVMPLTTINACYMLAGNYMNILPAYMLSPTFSPQQNDAQNYANMMAWGHEITHGFDTNGANYNKIGDLETLWATEADSQEFQHRTQQLIDYYSTLDVMPFETGLKNDGAYTVSENVADLGGFFLAYDSYVKHLKKQGFKGEQLRLQQQRFYEAYAYFWSGKWTANVARERTIGDESKGIEKDIHSLFRERVNGIVTNTDDWYDLFGVKAGDKLYLAPKDRIRIW
jgi:predicted metalloendopeptidase